MDLVKSGATSLRQTLNELTAGSLDTDSSVPAAIMRIVVGLLAALGVCALFQKSVDVAYLIGGSLAISLALVWVTHWKIGAGFPEGGALYLIPMVTLFSASLVRNRGRAELTFVVLAAMCAAHYADHVKLAYRGEGELAGGREVAKALRADAKQRGVRIAVSGPAEPVLRYYRWRYRQPNWEQIEVLQGGAFDYYVLTAQDLGLIQMRGLKVLYRDAGLVLAK
jgi:hypothetical protein